MLTRLIRGLSARLAARRAAGPSEPAPNASAPSSPASAPPAPPPPARPAAPPREPAPPRRGAVKAEPGGPVDVLARTIWGEARGEPTQGREAVAAVVMNRVAKAQARGGHWWGDDVVGVCRAPWQFSCWNEGDPNREKLLAVDEADRAFRECLQIASRAVAGALADPTGGATHYHHERVAPFWAEGRAPIARIGPHLFYRDIA